MLLGVVFMGRSTSPANNPAPARFGGFGGGVSALDELSAADVAARIAQGADLIVAENVQNLADSHKAQVEFSGTDSSYVSKPQQVTTDAKTKTDIDEYVVQPGDTVDSIARKFNITSDTIKWENSLYGDVVPIGKILKILPVSGIRYTVKEGDTAESIAETYKAKSIAYLIAFNDAEVGGFTVGDTIIIPDGTKPEVRQTYFSSGYGFAFGSQPLYGGNGYSYGYCTWHAANRRIQIGKPLPRNLGNAVTWATLAAQAGIPVGPDPIAGDVIWHRNTYIAGGLGHVGFVEQVNPDGSILVSDMNYPYWNGVTYRTISPSEFGQYLFIH